ncbi:HPt (histidine-containing phosphotransfer) domain-containing protein [Oxalobacteraceae bacterium GrIS 1.11]
MATLVDPDFRARLNALSDKYAATVPGLLQDIAGALALCQASGRGWAQLSALETALHAVAGSGGTFGFGVLGQECRRLEHLLRPLVEGALRGSAPGDEGQWLALVAHIAQLLQWAARDPKAGAFLPV